MDSAQLAQIKDSKGFIAALDQSGGSTPKALSLYGVETGAYSALPIPSITRSMVISKRITPITRSAVKEGDLMIRVRI